MITRLEPSQRITIRTINSLIDQINRAMRISVTGLGTRSTQGSGGTQISISGSGAPGPPGSSVTVAKVIDHNSRGGGYYNCQLQRVDAGSNWDRSEQDIFSDTEADVVTILNLGEHNGDAHGLAVNDLLVCWTMTDNATVGNKGAVYIGFSPKYAWYN